MRKHWDRQLCPRGADVCQMVREKNGDSLLCPRAADELKTWRPKCDRLGTEETVPIFREDENRRCENAGTDSSVHAARTSDTTKTGDAKTLGQTALSTRRRGFRCGRGLVTGLGQSSLSRFSRRRKRWEMRKRWDRQLCPRGADERHDENKRCENAGTDRSVHAPQRVGLSPGILRGLGQSSQSRFSPAWDRGSQSRFSPAWTEVVSPGFRPLGTEVVSPVSPGFREGVW